MVKKYYIHPMAFGSEQNPGYGHVEVIKYEDYAAMEKDRDYWYTRCLDAGLLDEEAEMDATKRARVFNE